MVTSLRERWVRLEHCVRHQSCGDMLVHRGMLQIVFVAPQRTYAGSSATRLIISGSPSHPAAPVVHCTTSVFDLEGDGAGRTLQFIAANAGNHRSANLSQFEV